MKKPLRLPPIARLPTQVPGLDEILKGGLLRGGIYLLAGRPGAGKTILANQIAFRHVANGGRGLYVTLLTESHARLLSCIEPLSFFDPAVLAGPLSYLSGYQTLETERLPGLLSFLRRAVKDHRATLLVVDGLVTAGALAESELEFKKFLHELQVLVELVGCTVLLLTGALGEEVHHYAEQTMVDGLIRISLDRVGMRSVRQLEVTKLRGSDVLLGRHFFQISNEGVTVHPRVESILGARPQAPSKRREKLGFGIESLDRMLDGGILDASTTLLLGAPGAGKTLLGLSFLCAAPAKSPGLYFGFFEQPDRIASKADQIGLGLSKRLGSGDLELLWQQPFEQLADALAERLIQAVKRRGVKRLFIDGLIGFEGSVIHPERLSSFFTALCNELRTLGVTTLISSEARSSFVPAIDLPAGGISAGVESILLLRYVELRSQLRRLISVLKKREGTYDPSLREFSISSRGIEVASTSKSAEAILSGAPHDVSDPMLNAPPGPKGPRPPRRGRS